MIDMIDMIERLETAEPLLPSSSWGYLPVSDVSLDGFSSSDTELQ